MKPAAASVPKPRGQRGVRRGRAGVPPSASAGAGGGGAKSNGAYYTPLPVVAALVRWAARHAGEVLLDPSCGDGRFLAAHPNAVGVERDSAAAAVAAQRAPRAEVHRASFFAWAKQTNRRFDCAAGNPPFIRYQAFNGATRQQALAFCTQLGVRFSALTASWAPFVVATASLLRRGGRMAFVVPAAIGHAPYAAPLLDYLVGNFDRLQLVALRRKLFPALSEDCWLLFAEGFGGCAKAIHITASECFQEGEVPPAHTTRVELGEWRRAWRRRLRPYLLGEAARVAYRSLANLADAPRHCDAQAVRLGDVAHVGIGYVSGANGFFHLRPSEAKRWRVPEGLLLPTVRTSRLLPSNELTAAQVHAWRSADEPMLLLRIPKYAALPDGVREYLDTAPGHRARQGYKCRHRQPWYAVPDVRVPDYFLTYMAGRSPQLVRNSAGAACTNALHAVVLRDRAWLPALRSAWDSSLTQLSCELEGHALGGGLLKLEPREAARVLLPSPAALRHLPERELNDAVALLRRWRHYG